MNAIYRKYIRLLLALALFLNSNRLSAQITDSVQAEEDYSQYGSVEESVKYCSQKVRLLSPTKLISVGYEVQAPFDADFPEYGPDYTKNKVERFGGLRWQANAPVISNNKFILNLGASYYESNLRFGTKAWPGGVAAESDPIPSALSKGLRTMGLNATAFKPLDEKRFLIASVLADLNGNFTWNSVPDGLPNPTFTFAVLYGWKRNENTQLAFGATQTWRGGERLYVPLLLYNKTFNDRWGLEMLLPARAHVRYNFSTKSLLLGGFELEGNSYRIQMPGSPVADALSTPHLELRRSELKARLVYEQRLFGFVWLSVQAGWRYNYRFNFSESRGSKSGDFLVESKLGNPLYGAISINLVSP